MRDGTSILPADAELASARRTFIIGDRDQFASTEDMGRYATDTGVTMQVLKGSDHFFYFREDEVGRLTADGLASGESPERDP